MNKRPKGSFTRDIDNFICEKLNAMNAKELQKVIDECDSLTTSNCSWIRYDLRDLVRGLAWDQLRVVNASQHALAVDVLEVCDNFTKARDSKCFNCGHAKSANR